MAEKKITTAGALFIKSMLPTQAAKDNFDMHRILDKDGMSQLINMLIAHGGDKAFDTINILARIFFEKATEIGTTTPLTDYENDSDERQALFGEFEHKVKDILVSKDEPKVKTKKLDELAASTRVRLNRDNL